MSRSSLALALALLATGPVAQGCGRIGYDPATGGQPNLCDYPPVGTCIPPDDGDLGSATGAAVAMGALSADETGEIDGSCVDLGNPADAFFWTAPSDGTFVFDSVGSDVPVALVARLGTCDGPELICKGNGADTPLRLTLIAGDRVVLGVVGPAGADASYVLNIRAVEEGRCADGIDNDGDGRTDCGDDECAGAVRCTDYGRCTTGIDGDGDGLVGCDDDDCRCDPSCVRCEAQDLGSAIGAAVATGSYLNHCDELTVFCATNAAPDALFRFSAPRAGRYRFDTAGSGTRSTLTLIDGACDGAQLACNSHSPADQTHSAVWTDLTAGQEITVALSGDSGGDYTLNIALDERGMCTGGADEDGDGDVDCADPDCADSVGCTELGLCANTVDDDGDGDVDCDDTDCAEDGACTGVVVAGCPLMDLGSAVGGIVTAGSTERASNDVECTSIDTTGPDTGYLWTAPADGAYRIGIKGEYDTVLQIRAGSCGGPVIACEDNIDDGRTLELRAGQQLVIFADSHEGGMGGFEVVIDPPETVCDDGLDNNGNGFADCADANCASHPTCSEGGRCANGADDDGDGAIDCADDECTCDPACVTRSCPDADLGDRLGAAVASDDTSTGAACGTMRATCKSTAGPERSYLWRAPFTGTFRFDSAGSTLPSVVYVLAGGCGGPELGCDYADPVAEGGIVVQTLEKGDEVVVVVEGQHGEAGPFQLNVTVSEQGRCGNGVDDDGDGLADCADDECTGDVFCCADDGSACVCR